MGRDLSKRTVLPPASHAPIDQPRIPFGAFRRAEAKTLHHARPIALDQGVGRLDQRQRFCDRFRKLQIKGNNSLSPAQGTVGERPLRIAELGFVRADDGDHLGAEIRQHAAGQRTWTDPLELDHLQACKRTHHALPPGRLLH